VTSSVIETTLPSARVRCHNLSATGSGSMLSLCYHAASSPAQGVALCRVRSGPQRAAIMYTLFQTARFNDVDPQA
jgi:hypothetical protein